MLALRIGAPEVTIETVAIDSIQLDPANLRRHPDKNLATIKGSLTRFGQQKPIVVDGRGIVIAGNGTWQAAKALGWNEIKIVRTSLAGPEATAFAIADNRTAELAEWDTPALADVLSALQVEDAGLSDAAGFTMDEIAALVGAEPAPAPAAKPPEDFPEVDENVQTEHQCPRCGYRWSGNSAPQGAE
jgi:ParB-like chromosome segregation protein Spo0J